MSRRGGWLGGGRRPSRTSGGGRGRGVLAVLVGCAIAFALAGGGTGAAAFTTGATDRGTGVDVAADSNGALTLDTATAVHVNSTERLVTVTNHLGRDVTVTVSLDADSQSKGDLVVDGVNEGNATTFALGSGANQKVDIAVPDDSTLENSTVYFDTEATASGLSAVGPDRAVPVEGETT